MNKLGLSTVCHCPPAGYDAGDSSGSELTMGLGQSEFDRRVKKK